MQQNTGWEARMQVHMWPVHVWLNSTHRTPKHAWMFIWSEHVYYIERHIAWNPANTRQCPKELHRFFPVNQKILQVALHHNSSGVELIRQQWVWKVGFWICLLLNHDNVNMRLCHHLYYTECIWLKTTFRIQLIFDSHISKLRLLTQHIHLATNPIKCQLITFCGALVPL